MWVLRDDGRQDELFEVLYHPRRRFTLQYLQIVETPISVGELTTELVAWAAEQPAADHSGADGDTIEVELVHCHLPKMADAGVVRYDATRKTVALADRTDEVWAHLQAMTTS